MLLIFVVSVFASESSSHAQHCLPIGSSYLSEISLKSLEKGKITLRVEHLKTGGRRKDSYQFYLLAYLDRNSEKFPTPLKKGERNKYGDQMFDESLSVVLDTSIAQRNEKGFYVYSMAKNSAELADELKTKLLAKSAKTVDGGWGRFEDQIRLAIFVPFLEDERYANLKGLPKDRHECNYANDRALIWQELPYRLSVHFYEFENKTVEKDKKTPKSYIQINGDQRKKTSY